MKTTDKIIQLLKLHGPLTAKNLAEELALTTMGVRQHLQALEASGEVDIEDRIEGRGRPTRYWELTEQSKGHFADRHNELSVQLIDSVKQIFGDQGLDKLIDHREQSARSHYSAAMLGCADIPTRLAKLVELRTQEGYIATSDLAEGVYYLFENHCPICSAASQCVSFCGSELRLFQFLFADVASVSREEHIIEGARRCAYRITPLFSSLS